MQAIMPLLGQTLPLSRELRRWSIYKSMGVYEVVPRSEIDECGGKLIDTSWIDTDKANDLNPEYWSRLVGREFNTGKDDSLYASTPHSIR